jgi:hypothetical protein
VEQVGQVVEVLVLIQALELLEQLILVVAVEAETPHRVLLAVLVVQA